jgi:hypothetical protein
MKKFELTFPPTIEGTYIINENNSSEVIRTLSIIWNKDFLEYIANRNSECSVSNIFRFYKETDSYSCGYVYDGIDNHFFEIKEVEWNEK